MEIPSVLVQPDMFVGWMQALHTLVTRPVPTEPVRAHLPEHMSTLLSHYLNVFMPYIFIHLYPCRLHILHSTLQPTPNTLNPPNCQEGGSDPKQSPWWKVKKWSLHIAYRLFSRYSVTKHAKEGNDRAYSEMYVVGCPAEV